MALVSLSTNDADPQRVIDGRVIFPRIGVWHAEFKVDSEIEFSEDDAVTIAVNGDELQLVGTITRCIEYGGILQVRVVAGVATADPDTGLRGLQRLAAPRFYQQPNMGTLLADLVGDSENELADELKRGGAIPGTSPDMPSWTTIAAPIGRQISELLRGAAWRFKPDGTFWAGAEEWPETEMAENDWQTLSYDHWNGIITFGLLSPTLLPGTTIGGYRADRVEMTIAGDKVTAQVWEPRDDGPRIDRDLQALGRGPGRPVDFFTFYAGALKSMSENDQTFDVQPDDVRLPTMSQLKIRNGIPGLKVLVQNGAKMLVGWDGGDPRRAYCATWSAETYSKNSFGAGDQAFVRGNDWKQMMMDLLDAIEAITVPTGTGPSGVPINQSQFEAIRNALDGKLSTKIFGE